MESTGRFVRTESKGDEWIQAGDGEPNFIITGSHSFCPVCRAYMREQMVVDRMRRENITHDESERKQKELEQSVEKCLGR